MANSGLYWFNHDLRVHDNPALLEAYLNCDKLICLFVIDEAWFKQTGLNAKPMGEHRYQFLLQSLSDLNKQLSERGQKLVVMKGEPVDIISTIVKYHQIDAIYRSQHVGVYENRQWHHLQADFPRVHFHSVWSHTLFRPEQLPFGMTHLPESFSQFRVAVESVNIDPPCAMPKHFPLPITSTNGLPSVSLKPAISTSKYVGGEMGALMHLDDYFSSQLPANYKNVRNELDGWKNSTKFSAWLASGNISPRKLFQRLKEFERKNTANESTYWIYFELLWREYFQWYANRFQQKLFQPQGVSTKKISCCFYPERYKKWCNGNTPHPLINACMKQLNETGYMSNRGRQIVASYFVNELQLDWRFGAAYFEQQLIDYDVASNWGNWQYIAGVGPDPRGGRHFNIDKQMQQYDPNQAFIKRWDGAVTAVNLDSVDAADWPIMPKSK
ncbi:MAG TPA: DASH family cryptochrome [Methylophaga aminisulfidivorans]|nr:DASH family cryptochrome [Methylophaga aminisulfidivorans]